MKEKIKNNIKQILLYAYNKINILNRNKEKNFNFCGWKISKKDIYYNIMKSRKLKADKYLKLFAKNTAAINYVISPLKEKRCNIFLDELNATLGEEKTRLIIKTIMENDNVRIIIDDYNMDYMFFNSLLKKYNLVLPKTFCIHFLKKDCFRIDSEYLLEINKTNDVFIISSLKEELSLLEIKDLKINKFYLERLKNKNNLTAKDDLNNYIRELEINNKISIISRKKIIKNNLLKSKLVVIGNIEISK